MPVHLIAIGARERLQQFLLEWDVFDHLYNEEYSAQLMSFWRKVFRYSNLINCLLKNECYDKSVRKSSEVFLLEICFNMHSTTA